MSNTTSTSTAAKPTPRPLRNAKLIGYVERTSNGKNSTKFLQVAFEYHNPSLKRTVKGTGMAWGKSMNRIVGLPEGSALDLFGFWQNCAFQILDGGTPRTEEEIALLRAEKQARKAA